MTNFFPENFKYLREDSKSNKPYWSFFKKEAGDYKFRILGPPIGGWIDWKTEMVEIEDKETGKLITKEKKTPIRTTPDNKRPPINPKVEPKKFWSYPIWNYQTARLEIWEIQQISINDRIEALAKDQDFGIPTAYDIKVTKIIKALPGDKKKVEYVVNALFPKELPDDIVQVIKATPYRLEALYEGKDPFKDLEKMPTEEATVYQTSASSVASDNIGQEEKVANIDDLRAKLNKDGINDANLKSFLESYASETGKTINQIIEMFVLPQMYETCCGLLKQYNESVAA